MPKNETGRRGDISYGEYGMHGFSVNIAIRTPQLLLPNTITQPIATRIRIVDEGLNWTAASPQP
jgi:hypothetical protein